MGEVYLEKMCYEINGAVFAVFRELGAGFLEKVYERALLIELKARDIDASSQSPVRVRYKGEIVGEYIADIVVNDEIIIEIKAIERLLPVHTAQVLNYLKATKYKLGLLVNFSHPKAEIKRYVL